MRAYFDEQKGNLGNRPATISFRQIVIAPRPSPAAKARTRAQADSIVLELRRGADFATAAKRFSQDPGSKDQGGSLNWFRRGVMVPEFERVAFALKPGVVSDPVESPFGYHIIQVERVQPGEVQARHILLIPQIDSVHVDSARALADSVRGMLQRGASFDSLQRIYTIRPPSGTRTTYRWTSCRRPTPRPIGQADSGTVVPVFTVPGGGAREQFVVLQVTGRRPQGDIRYEDVRDHIRDQFGQQLAIRRYLDELRKATYVEIAEAVRESGTGGPARAVPQSWPRSRSPRRPARHRARDRRARARATRVDAEITLIGADDQIAAIRAAGGVSRRHLGPGQRRAGGRSGRARSAPAASPATRSRRRSSSRSRARWTRSSPRPPTSTRCTSRAFPTPATPSGWRSSRAAWTWR